jgi:hypothetical protein
MELRVPRGIYGRRVFWLTIVLSAAVLLVKSRDVV